MALATAPNTREGGASLLFPRIYSPLVLYFVLLLIIFSRERMEVIISIVGSLAAKAAEYAVDPLARQLSYLFKPRSKFLNLRTKVQELKDARERVQQSVNSATRKGDVIFDDVQRWLTVVDEKISEEAATQLQDDEGNATKSVMAHDADVEDLLRYAIGLGFIHNLNTIEASRDRVLTLLQGIYIG
ncbi:hypothetical protein V6N13_103211 [Hibiscus sabdariffa]